MKVHKIRVAQSNGDLHYEPISQIWPSLGTFGTLAGVPEDLCWTLSPLESEKHLAIGFSDLDLVHFHTPHLNIGQTKQNLLFFQFALLSCSQNGRSVFTQHAFKGRRCNRSWIRKRLRNRGAFPKKICKIQPKSLLLASFPGKKVRRVGPGKPLSEGGKWGLVKQA